MKVLEESNSINLVTSWKSDLSRLHMKVIFKSILNVGQLTFFNYFSSTTSNFFFKIELNFVGRQTSKNYRSEKKLHEAVEYFCFFMYFIVFLKGATQTKMMNRNINMWQL